MLLGAFQDRRRCQVDRAVGINAGGLWKVPFLLFKDGDSSSAYRELHAHMRVKQRPPR